ncbi:AraC family transcriptional regulator [Chitinophaga lutea]|uniref:AraC family transcriptional regulator n=1 Tax=Chitinophaga lutea TaxID=2488634 RepID=A0A3N4Q2F7_9BACT|nr:helix-turn-helix domain-containing protein [Chitinophaga lutea]RPE05954.1 AraC family transcriptional regulator [Chitinophaga lutea]
MEADIHTLFTSGLYRILDFKCRCTECHTSKPEQSDTFTISFVRTGNFLFNVFRNSLDSYNGCFLITKPGYDRTVTHVHTVPDECTIFDFSDGAYREIRELYGRTRFFRSNDLHSTLLQASPELEYTHFHILQLLQARQRNQLQIDQLVLEMAQQVLGSITLYRPNEKLNDRLKKNHLVTVERAKAYMSERFVQDVSLQEVAAHCHISPFHFSRIFKSFTGCSPHQFLTAIRLKNAAILLQNTFQPVADIGFASGFNSAEHFVAAFRQRYRCSPSDYRRARTSSALKTDVSFFR